MSAKADKKLFIRENSNRVYLILSIVFLGFVGLQGGYWVYKDTSLALSSHDWVQGEAIITRSTVVENPFRGRSYGFYVRYEFLTPDSRVIQGERYTIPPKRYYSDKKVADMADRYRVNSVHPVYYDAAAPEDSVLIKPSFNGLFTFFLGGLSLLLFFSALFLLFILIKGLRNDAK